MKCWDQVRAGEGLRVRVNTESQAASCGTPESPRCSVAGVVWGGGWLVREGDPGKEVLKGCSECQLLMRGQGRPLPATHTPQEEQGMGGEKRKKLGEG